MDITFFFDLHITKVADEYLNLTHKEDGEMEGCLRVYSFEGVFRRYDCDDQEFSKKLLKNPNWSASFNYDEDEICIDNDLDNISLTKQICFDEDWDDYEEIEPIMKILYQGDFYNSEEFKEPVEIHDLEFIYDNCKITSVNARLNKVEVDYEEINPNELLNNLE